MSGWARGLSCRRAGRHGDTSLSDRDAMNAILLVLRTGMQWNALNATGICSCSSAYRRFREWAAAGVFLEFWRQGCLPTTTSTG